MLTFPSRNHLLCAVIAAGAATAFLITDAAVGASAAANRPTVVEAVQSPAWIERNGERIPATPGMALRERDHVVTGASSRIVLRLPEGSSVKLGENASFLLSNSALGRDNVYVGAMHVLEGAFRFTTDALAKFRGRRAVEVRFYQVTAGIRGTDVWGKQAGDRDIVCLIEGRVEVQRGTEAPIAMDQPLSFYIAPRGQASLPVAPVSRAQIDEWAAETEIASGRGALRRGGTWKVILASPETQADALKFYDELRAAGFAASILPTMEGEKHIYHVRLTQLPSRADAQALAEALRGKYGIADPKVSR